MSSSERRLFVTGLAAVLLGGCGFRPVYGPRGSAKGLRGRFEMEAPDNRNAFTLVGRLEERLGRPEGPDLRLTYDIVLESDELAISSANNIERYNIIGRIGYTVSRVGSPAVLTRGAVENFTSYSTTALTVGTLAAEEDARERLMILLADQIVAQLLATAGEWMPPR